jgi:hypothetical protein
LKFQENSYQKFSFSFSITNEIYEELLRIKSCVSKIKDSEEHLLSVYKSLLNSDPLAEEIKILQQRNDYLIEESKKS